MGFHSNVEQILTEFLEVWQKKIHINMCFRLLPLCKLYMLVSSDKQLVLIFQLSAFKSWQRKSAQKDYVIEQMSVKL